MTSLLESRGLETRRIASIPGGGRRLWSRPDATWVLGKGEPSQPWHRWAEGKLVPGPAFPRYVSDLCPGPRGVLGFRGRTISLGRGAHTLLALFDGERVVECDLGAGVIAVAWSRTGPVAGLDDGRVVQLDCDLKPLATVNPTAGAGWTATTAVASSGAHIWAATWDAVVVLDLELRRVLSHEVGVAPLNTEQMVVSEDGDRAACRSAYGCAVLDLEGRMGEFVGCEHFLVSPEAQILAQSDRGWVRIGQSEALVDRLVPAYALAAFAGGVAGRSEAWLRHWVPGRERPVLRGVAQFSRTLRDFGLDSEGGLLVLAGDLFQVAVPTADRGQ